MRVVFLDFDGVMNSRHFFEGGSVAHPRDPTTNLDVRAVARVNRILKEGNAEAVISSSWRCGTPQAELENTLVRHGFNGRVVGITPNIPGPELRVRGDEIHAWLQGRPPVESFVILDDDSDMEPWMPRLVQTTFVGGLKDKHVKRAVKMLNQPLSETEKAAILKLPLVSPGRGIRRIREGLVRFADSFLAITTVDGVMQLERKEDAHPMIEWWARLLEWSCLDAEGLSTLVPGPYHTGHSPHEDTPLSTTEFHSRASALLDLFAPEMAHPLTIPGWWASFTRFAGWEPADLKIDRVFPPTHGP